MKLSSSWPKIHGPSIQPKSSRFETRAFRVPFHRQTNKVSCSTKGGTNLINPRHEPALCPRKSLRRSGEALRCSPAIRPKSVCNLSKNFCGGRLTAQPYLACAPLVHVATRSLSEGPMGRNTHRRAMRQYDWLYSGVFLHLCSPYARHIRSLFSLIIPRILCHCSSSSQLSSHHSSANVVSSDTSCILPFLPPPSSFPDLPSWLASTLAFRLTAATFPILFVLAFSELPFAFR